MIRKILTKFALLAGLLASTPVDAALLVYEGFDYELGSRLNQKNGGIGFRNPWEPREVLVTEGLTYDGLLTTGNAISHFGNDTSRSTIEVKGTVTWVSFLMRLDDSSQMLGPGEFSYLGFRANGGSVGGRLGVWTNSEGSFLGVEGATSNVPFLAGTTYLVVASITWNSGGPETIDLFVNPTPGASGPGERAATAETEIKTDGGTHRIYNIYALAGTYSNIMYDEIRVGESYADVTPVPEPASFFLLSVGIFSLGIWKLQRYRKG